MGHDRALAHWHARRVQGELPAHTVPPCAAAWHASGKQRLFRRCGVVGVVSVLCMQGTLPEMSAQERLALQAKQVPLLAQSWLGSRR